MKKFLFVYLEEEDKGYPLVIAVVGFFLILITQSWMGHFRPYNFSLFVWQSESVSDPTEGIYHMGVVYSIVYALDWIS